MRDEALAGREPAPVTITRYHPPSSPADVLVMLAVSSYLVCAAALPWIVPGSAPWALLGALFPGGPHAFRRLVTALLGPVLVIHALEPLYLDVSRLRRHRLRRWSRPWLLWMGSCALEGIMAFRRFDRLVARMEAEAKRR